MRFYVAMITIATMASAVKAAALLGDYNTISVPFYPQTYSNQLQYPSPGVVPAHQQHQDLSNHAVVENALAESQLPHELLNPFYKNPSIAAALAKESWFGHNEFPVHHREAEKIPRKEIYKIISRLH